MRRGVQDLAEYYASRSICNVKVGAVFSDNWGVFGFGWNHAGVDSKGECAERKAIKGLNRKRLRGSKLTVFASRKGIPILARPCEKFCLKLIKKLGIKTMEYTTKGGVWKTESL
ncbi:MAG: hypothetical protein Q7S12_03510 [bacterium]|nr:hypothetical protein [bacterium]